MGQQHIALPNTPGAVMVAQLVSTVIRAKQLADRLKGLMDAYTGGGSMTAAVETDTSFWNVGSGNGRVIYDQVVGIKKALDSLVDVANLDQGGG